MSRIGRAPITVPAGVTVKINDQEIVVSGPKGELRRPIHPEITVHQDGSQLIVERPSESVQHRSLHGLIRSLVNNMVVGVVSGFEKTIVMTGVGYRIGQVNGRVSLQLGYSHPIEIVTPEGIEIGSIETFTPNQSNEWLSGRLTVRGIDKAVVGEVAANIRRLRPVEPYKGKGLRYLGERVRRKAGKAAGKGKK